MTKLNLTANGKPQELILAYLQENARDTLAEKINSGVFIEKDGKRLLNKKDLDGFMKYATAEARKLADKGATSACIEDSVVYGWAIHYFEEDSIEGKMFNEDGTPYTPEKSITKKTVPVKTIKPTGEKEKQTSLFDMLSATPKAKPTDDDELVEDNYDDYAQTETVIDKTTGEVFPVYAQSNLDNEYTAYLQNLLDNKIITKEVEK